MMKNSMITTYASQALAFVVAIALVAPAIGALASWGSVHLRNALSQAAAAHPAARVDVIDVATSVLTLTLPLLLAAGVAGAVALAVQTGGIVATKRLAPKLERLDPTAGIKGLFSAARLFAVVRAFVASAIIAWLAYAALRDHVVDFARVAGRPAWIGAVLREVAGGLAWRAALIGLVIAALDVVVTRSAWRRKLRMTKDEVKREHRDAEGDPQLKAARERAYHELITQAAVANVRAASVVVVNPTHLACALRYDEKSGDEAPVVVASGQGDIAARITQAAHDHGIPVVRNVDLARALVELEPGQTIPEGLYEAVAEILREVWQER